MIRSLGLRFFIVGLLILLMFIPVLFVGDIIDARADYNRETRSSVGQEWGGRQLLSGPVLIIPVQETVVVREKREVLDPETGIQKLDADDNPVYRFVDVERTLNRAPVYLYPDRFEAEIDTTTQERHRGIFTVPVYSAEAVLEFDFPTEAAVEALINDERLIWDAAELHLSVTSNRALRGAATLEAGQTELQMEPRAINDERIGGVRAPTGDPRRHDGYRLSLDFNGAETLSIAPVGRDSTVRFSSDWAHPSFFGAFLPDGHDISETGFSATWSIPHLARPLPQLSRESQDWSARQSTSFGVDLYQPNDFYQKSYRAARYGILFIGLTFLTIFLIEGQTKRPTHPVQYILVGLAQSAFFLLMLALAEQMGFAIAYLVAASATVGLITAFGALALQLGKRTLVLGLLLSALYGVLYLILRSADYALLAGSVLTFAAIAGTMFATRNENWYGAPKDPGQRRGWFVRKPAPAAPQPDPSASAAAPSQGTHPQG
ncbi:cell envelope integrity protein CreD [Roseovarius faecimaris]|uniref:Cell envelope integrity protein CreD n=1 Tax=Roseovarius faecimaris TaxID=2494550 RepID=A0A6I6IQ52_9RHOB|nr:cell envelope integrity protein CreD [Roseovarius faecimaris]QGX97336.1 cell envelope integrity protein CreD [Roseovarius faecimaris]